MVRRGPNSRIPVFPASSAEAERQTQNFTGPGSFSLISRAGPVVLYFFAHLPGQRFSMSQILFQQLVLLQVKCRDCERGGFAFPVPVGGGWGLAMGKDGGPPLVRSGHGRVSSRSPRRETYLGPGSLSKFSSPRREVRNGTLTCITLI